MTQYRKTRKLPPEEAAYIAGLIDGEGTISLSRRHRHDNRQLVISISNTDQQLLRHVHAAVGTGRITRKRVTATNHTPSVTYSVSNRQALDLLTQITPYLRTYKAQRAKLVLKHYLRLTPRNGKYSDKLANERQAFVERFLNLNPRRPMRPKNRSD